MSIIQGTDKISIIKGIGEKTEYLFNKAGIKTISDLLSYYPRGFEIYEDPVSVSEVQEGKVQTVTGRIFGPVQASGGRKIQVTTLHLKDMTGTLKVIWFRMPFLRNTLKNGSALTVRGKVVRRRDGLVLEHPEIFFPASKYNEKIHTMQPVYPLTSGLTSNMVAKAVRQVLNSSDMVSVNDILPQEIETSFHFMTYKKAIRCMHFPASKEEYTRARERFVFEEFLVFILSLRRIKDSESRAKNAFLLKDSPLITQLLESLPYELTKAQKKVWDEIRKDLKSTHVMSRLVQGDVGSGKTIIAFLSLFLTGLNGCQGALMAPTEVLARQHFENFCKMTERYDIPLKAELLTGSMTAAQKRKAYEGIRNGDSSIIIGTHALIQEKATYKNLALVITDEQHRFGVRQREALAGKGQTPHILVMSATPIPRTLAIILYGDLDISVIDELPKNRLPIKNCVVDTGYRHSAYSFIRRQISEGHQCYVICPMVEESEAMEAENVTDYSARLTEELGSGIRVGCLHGKMKQNEKDRIMDEFASGDIDILVSTTVIEVGIDVPNATVIMIENAERFGLAQLHQLRGRVGRGSSQSYCIFMTPSKSKETKERLEILNKSNDGFFIAGEDLRLRGPGDLFGIRQSGLLDFKTADVFQDAPMLQEASKTASKIMEKDPDLSEYPKLKKYIDVKISEIMLETTL